MSLFKKSSPLSKVLESWIKNPDTDISEGIDALASSEVTKVDEAQLIIHALEILRNKLQHSFDERTEDNLYALVVLFQQAGTPEAATHLNGQGITLLVEILDVIKAKQHPLKEWGSTDMMMLKMLAYYKNRNAFSKLVEYMNAEYKPDNYLWSVIMNIIGEDDDKYKFLIDSMKDKIPADFLGISYLDMCNGIAMRTNGFQHPFNSQAGFIFLENVVKNSSAENESYVVSATASVPFLSKAFQAQLLPAIASYSNMDIQMEAAWAGTKIGDEASVNKLIHFANDYRYHFKAASYLRELGLENKIPAETNTPDFQALSEMSHWLSHPNEFGTYPDSAEIFDKRELYWPPTRDRRTIYLVKYTYKNHKEDGSDEVGIGLVGSVTFSLFGLKNMLELKPTELLAIHCNWELEKENYDDIQSGLELLRKHNSELE